MCHVGDFNVAAGRVLRRAEERPVSSAVMVGTLRESLSIELMRLIVPWWLRKLATLILRRNPKKRVIHRFLILFPWLISGEAAYERFIIHLLALHEEGAFLLAECVLVDQSILLFLFGLNRVVPDLIERRVHNVVNLVTEASAVDHFLKIQIILLLSSIALKPRSGILLDDVFWLWWASGQGHYVQLEVIPALLHCRIST